MDGLEVMNDKVSANIDLFLGALAKPGRLRVSDPLPGVVASCYGANLTRYHAPMR